MRHTLFSYFDRTTNPLSSANAFTESTSSLRVAAQKSKTSCKALRPKYWSSVVFGHINPLFGKQVGRLARGQLHEMKLMVRAFLFAVIHRLDAAH
jgi:hypothetical protein